MANRWLKFISVFLLLSLAVICEATVEKADGQRAESWSEWAKKKLSVGLTGAKATDLGSSDTNKFDDTAKKTKDKISETTTGAGKYTADKATEAEDKTSELGGKTSEKTGAAKEKASELGGKASEKTGSAKDKASELGKETYEKAGEAKDKVAEEGEKRATEGADTLSWAKEKVIGGYDAAKAKAGETYESAKDKSRQVIENLHPSGHAHDDEL
ncbi:uncharacterized protein LOC142519468 [Primulina tabacum]|uniref:uncharacterized protein LOC142519468 n=1 Tax=Primulina tabacum TaxID=48773 RepID=UPI003F59D70C